VGATSSFLVHTSGALGSQKKSIREVFSSVSCVIFFFSKDASHMPNGKFLSYGKISVDSNTPSANKALCLHRIADQITAVVDGGSSE
jgi:hypothetical protein